MLPRRDTTPIRVPPAWRSEFETPAAISAETFWPLALGNWWSFRGAGPDSQLRIEVVRKNGGWSKLEGAFGSRWWWMSRAGSSAWYWDPDRLSHRLGFDLSPSPRPSPARPSSELDRDVGDRLLVLTEAKFEVDSPLGRFEGCVRLDIARSPLAPGSIARIVLAPGFGPVEAWIVRAEPDSFASVSAGSPERTPASGDRALEVVRVVSTRDPRSS